MNDFKASLKFIRSNGIAMLQRPKEIHWLVNRILDNQKDKGILVEIGSGQGASAFILGCAMPEGSRIILIDKNHPDRRKEAVNGLEDLGYHVENIFGLSQDYLTRDALLRRLSGLAIDVLFIDGDHTIEAVRKDYDFYSKFVRKGGLIALHDIAKHPDKPDQQVWKLWDELKEGYNTIQYRQPKSHVGIGVVVK